MSPCVVRTRQFECFGRILKTFSFEILVKVLLKHVLEADLSYRGTSCDSIIQASNFGYDSESYISEFGRLTRTDELFTEILTPQILSQRQQGFRHLLDCELHTFVYKLIKIIKTQLIRHLATDCGRILVNSALTLTFNVSNHHSNHPRSIACIATQSIDARS